MAPLLAAELKPHPVYGRWRLEVEPTLDPKAALPPIRRLESADTVGAEIASGKTRYVLVFRKETLDVPQLIVQVNCECSWGRILSCRPIFNRPQKEPV